eukprot:1970575-Prymnesium_polylepis.1
MAHKVWHASSPPTTCVDASNVACAAALSDVWNSAYRANADSRYSRCSSRWRCALRRSMTASLAASATTVSEREPPG